MRHPTGAWPGAVTAVLAGALPALSFPAPSLWWLAYVALVPWLLLLTRAATGRHAALYGWLGGAGLMVATHHWLLPNLHVFLVLLTLLIGGLWAPWGWLAHRLLGPGSSGGNSMAALVLLPAGWLAAELVRSWEYLGGPWGLLGASQWQVEAALGLMSVGGVWLVTVLLVAVNTAVAIGLPHVRVGVARLAGRGWRPVGVAPLGLVAALCVLLVAAGGLAAGRWVERPEPRHTVEVAVVQPGVVEGVRARFTRGVELTREITEPVDLVVWGESSVGFDPGARPEYTDVLRRVAVEKDAPLLINVDALRAGESGIRKSSVLVTERGLDRQRYDKMRLVPFGEYVPARDVLGWVTAVGRAADEDRQRGERQVVLRTDGLRLGPLVCFETAFPDMSRELVDEGAEVLVAQSSTSSFQDGWAPAQHASLAALRSAETGRSVVHGTLTGVSAVFGPDGQRIGPPLGTDHSGAQAYSVPVGEGRTPYVRYGDWTVWLALAALGGYAAGSLVVAGRRRLRTRRAGRW